MSLGIMGDRFRGLLDSAVMVGGVSGGVSQLVSIGFSIGGVFQLCLLENYASNRSFLSTLVNAKIYFLYFVVSNISIEFAATNIFWYVIRTALDSVKHIHDYSQTERSRNSFQTIPLKIKRNLAVP